MSSPNRLSRTIYKLRSQLKQSQTDFAGQLGVSAMAVSRWENGTEPAADCIIKLAKMTADPEEFWFLLGQVGLNKRDVRG